MPIRTADTKEGLPEALRAGAIETKEGKWIADEVDPNAISPAAQAALDKEREKAKTETAARKAAEKERDELKQKQEAADKGISETELQKIKDAEALARKPIEEENARLKAENDTLKRVDKVRAVAIAKGILADRIDDAMALLDSRTVLTDQGNVAVKAKDGTVTTESLDTFLEKTFKTEKPWLYAGPGGSGGGGEQGGGGGGDASEAARATGKAMGEAQKKANTEASALARR